MHRKYFRKHCVKVKMTAATISERRMAGSLQCLSPKVGTLRQEEPMVGWWLYSAFPYSNHLCFTSSGLERNSSLLLRMELVVGLLSIPLVIVLMVLKTSLLLFCCMFVSSIWRFPLNHVSLSAFRPLWIDLVRRLYSWRKLGSWIAFFLVLLLSSVNARVSSEIQDFFFGLWIPWTSSAAFLMFIVVCSNRESAMGSLVSTCTSSSSYWNLFCSSSWKSFAMLGSSSLVMFHFFLLRPFFSTFNFTLIFARTREWSNPLSTLWHDLLLSTADFHLSLLSIKSIMFFDL